MTISIISDLHCRNKSFPPSFDVHAMKPADVLVVAGDLATHVNYDKMSEKLRESVASKFKVILGVKGNHDYYVTDPHWLRHHEIPVGPRVEDNYIFTTMIDPRGPVDFICSPLWSPIYHHELIRRSLNDYNFISGFTTQKCTELFEKNLAWLEQAVDESRNLKRRYVIVTHHLPIRELIHEAYRESDVNEAFCVLNEEYEKRLKALKPEIWIHGHSHNFLDAVVDGTRYVRNPYGYEWTSHDYSDGSSKERTGYVKDFIVEI